MSLRRIAVAVSVALVILAIIVALYSSSSLSSQKNHKDQRRWKRTSKEENKIKEASSQREQNSNLKMPTQEQKQQHGQEVLSGELSQEHLEYNIPASSSSSSTSPSLPSSDQIESTEFEFFIITYLDGRRVTQGLVDAATSRLCYARQHGYHLKIYTEKDIAHYFPPPPPPPFQSSSNFDNTKSDKEVEEEAKQQKQRHETQIRNVKYWSKNFLLGRCLMTLAKNRKKSWCIWIDSDIVITNPGLSLHHIFHRTISTWRRRRMRKRNALEMMLEKMEQQNNNSKNNNSKKKLEQNQFSRNQELPSLFVSSANGIINDGVMAMRNTSFSHSFLQEWRHSDSFLPLYFDNGPFVYVLFKRQLENQGVTNYQHNCSWNRLKQKQLEREEQWEKKEKAASASSLRRGRNANVSSSPVPTTKPAAWINFYWRFHSCTHHWFKRFVLNIPPFQYKSNLNKKKNRNNTNNGVSSFSSTSSAPSFQTQLSFYNAMTRFHLQHAFQICPRWNETNLKAFEDPDSFFSQKQQQQRQKQQPVSELGKDFFISELLGDDPKIVGDCRVNSGLSTLFYPTQHFHPSSSLGAHAAGFRDPLKRSLILSTNFLTFTKKYYQNNGIKIKKSEDDDGKKDLCDF